jgi:hypothetical protein
MNWQRKAPPRPPKATKLRFYGSRLAPIDVFSNLNSDYILHREKDSSNSKGPQEQRRKTIIPINRAGEGRSKSETRALSPLEQRDLLVDEFFHSLRNSSKDLFDLCEALVLSSSEYTSLAFIVSDKPILQISKEVPPSPSSLPPS